MGLLRRTKLRWRPRGFRFYVSYALGFVRQPSGKTTEKGEWGALEGWGQGEAWKRRIRPIPLGRPKTPEDVARVVAFFAGPDSDYMTGQAITVDGGLVMED